MKEITLPKLNFDFKLPLDSIDVSLIRGAVSVFLIFVIYITLSILLANGINKKNEEISNIKANVQEQIDLANNDLTKIQSKVSTYKNLKENLQQMNEKVAENYRTKNAIPRLLYHIMNIIPVNVQVTSIENINDKHVVINAQADYYEHLAYFTAGLRTGGILTNVELGPAQKTIIHVKVGDEQKEKEVIKVTIEGDLQ